MRMLRFSVAFAVIAAFGASAAIAAPANGTVVDHGGWYASLGTIVLTRSTPDAGVIVGNNPYTGSDYSDANAFSFGQQAGLDLGVGFRMPNSANGFDFRFFNADAISAADTFRTPGGFIGAGFTGPGNTLFVGQYFTSLDSAELNWRHNFGDRLAVLAGLRALYLRDDLTYTINTTVATGQYAYNNHLIGAQIGADLSLFQSTSPFQIDLVGKAGIFSNTVDGGTFDFSGANLVPVASFTANDTATSYLAEATISASYRLTSHLALRGGYQLTWLSNVGLGSNAAAYSLLNPSLLSNGTTRSNILFQGVTAGLNLTW